MGTEACSPNSAQKYAIVRLTDSGYAVANQVPADVASQQLDGIVLGAAPQRRVEEAEQRPRVAVPAPRQVGGNGREPCDPFREGGTAGLWLNHPACKLRPVGAAWEAHRRVRIASRRGWRGPGLSPRFPLT